MGRKEGAFLATMLASGRSEYAAHLPDQPILEPEPAVLVEEVFHLRCHVAESRRRAYHDRVVVRQLGHACHGGGLVQLVSGLASDIFRDQLRHPPDVDRGASLASALGNSRCNGLDMAIGGVIEHQYFRHDPASFKDVDESERIYSEGATRVIKK